MLRFLPRKALLYLQLLFPHFMCDSALWSLHFGAHSTHLWVFALWSRRRPYFVCTEIFALVCLEVCSILLLRALLPALLGTPLGVCTFVRAFVIISFVAPFGVWAFAPYSDSFWVNIVVAEHWHLSSQQNYSLWGCHRNEWLRTLCPTDKQTWGQRIRKDGE